MKARLSSKLRAPGRALGGAVVVALLVGSFSSCSGAFPSEQSNARLIVELTGGDQGSAESPLPLSFSTPSNVVVRITALRDDGSLDTSFNGHVRLSSKPGSVVAVTGEGAAGRSVRLAGGVAENVGVALLAAYGDARVWAEDEGYFPVDPTSTPPPQCSDGKDNDGDGVADFPYDPGCAFANDDTEAGGTYATGVSAPIRFIRPRIADVRGVESGGAATPFRSEQVSVDTGYRAETQSFAFDTIVTRISSNGFYVADVSDPRGYGAIFSFTFSSPARLRVCDRLKTFTGTATEFFGMTQLASPTWTVEFWNPSARPCLVPEPYGLKVTDLGNPTELFKREAALVRLETAGTVSVHVGAHFGPGFPEASAGYAPTDEASNCDLDRNGKLDFAPGSPEAACSDACDADIECVEYSTFVAQANFKLVAVDTAGGRAKLQANTGAAPLFSPLNARGKAIRSLTGTLEYFSGGSQFTLEARCEDDLVVEGEPMPSDRACVRPRTALDENEASQ